MTLRISMNSRRVPGPYGGANQFGNNLEKYLRAKGHEVFRQLVPGLDAIVIVSSQRHPMTTGYDITDIDDYIRLNPNTVVVQRVNSSDEARGENLGIDEAMAAANRVAHYTIFISSFVRDLFVRKGFGNGKPGCVILNGADEDIFHPFGRAEWEPGQKLRIVTHHWSTNFMKGFDIYERLDELLESGPFRDRFEFTYIGRTPTGVSFKNANVMPPMAGAALGKLLRRHHLYLTAARNEAGGMHHVEGMRCGLPVLYLRSGALPEYCAPYGVEFTLVSFEQRLLDTYERYESLRGKVVECPYTDSWMGAKYEEILLAVVAERRASPRPGPRFGDVAKLRLLTRPYRRLERLCELARRAERYLRGRSVR